LAEIGQHIVGSSIGIMDRNRFMQALQQALRNGKALEELLYQLGPELLRHYRKQRDTPRPN